MAEHADRGLRAIAVAARLQHVYAARVARKPVMTLPRRSFFFAAPAAFTADAQPAHHYACLLHREAERLCEHEDATVREVLDSVSIASYTLMRAYTGRASLVRLTAPRIAGYFYRDDSDITAADDGGVSIVDGKGRRWKRIYDGPANLLWFGAAADGATNDAPAIAAWLNWLCATGGSGYVPPGTYSMGSGLAAPLSASVNVVASAEAKFVAAAGFPSGQRMFLISEGTGSDHVFQWEGGQFDATNQPNSGARQANDIFSFNAGNCARCRIALDRTTAGADWLTSGSDSHLFIGGARNIHAEIGHCVGAVDAGIYISSSLAGTRGDSLYATGNFEKCNVGIIVKRLFETWTIEANVVDCANGVAGGTADSNVGATIGPGSGCRIAVNAWRTGRACSMMGVRGGSVEVVSTDMGVAITGHTSTSAKALYLSGSSKITGIVTASGVNSGCVKDTKFRAVDCDRRTMDATSHDATDNLLIINCDDVGKAFNEDPNSARNFFIVKENNVTTASTLSGANSSMHRANPSSSGFEIDEPAVSLAGVRGAEALRVVKIPSQVNFVQIGGAIAGTAKGVQVQARGADTNIPLSISSKGISPVLIGGDASSEALRVSTVAALVNGVEVTGSARGSPVTVAARGSEASVDLSISAKGVDGHIRMENIREFADDAAAAEGGVPITGLYRTASVLKIRIS